MPEHVHARVYVQGRVQHVHMLCCICMCWGGLVPGKHTLHVMLDKPPVELGRFLKQAFRCVHGAVEVD